MSTLEWARTSQGSIPILLDGQPIASVRAARWRERAEVVLDGHAWVFAADGRERAATRDDQPGRRLVASKPSFWRSGWQAECDGDHYELASAPLFSSAMVISREGQPVGSVKRSGFWSGRPVLTLDLQIPIEHRVFLLWIASLVYRRQQQAAAAS